MPEGLTNNEFKEHLLQALAKSISAANVINGEIIIEAQADKIEKILHFLKTDSNCSFEQLIAITAADYPSEEKRFEVVYCLLSLTYNRRLIVKIRTDENTEIKSAIGVYKSAGWYEREVWDMFGTILLRLG